MADLAQWFGQDLETSASGDLLAIDGTILGQQRVLRRLLTNPGAYIWELTYGAGLASYVGQTLDLSGLQALILTQISLESAVAADPPPVVTVKTIPGGIYVQILYVDADTGKQVNLSFDVPG